MELVREMGLGINLGNTYESCGDWIAQWGDGTPESYETAWGSPVITQEMEREIEFCENLGVKVRYITEKEVTKKLGEKKS